MRYLRAAFWLSNLASYAWLGWKLADLDNRIYQAEEEIILLEPEGAA